MRVLITGSQGFVGRNLSSYLRERGYEVVGIDIADGADIKLDISDHEKCVKVLLPLEFDVVVHLAAIANIPKSLEDPHRCFEVNSFGTLNMLEIASRKNVKRFIYASSANVYGIPLELPVRETTPPNPRTPYDYSKLISEKLIECYSRIRGVKAVIFRNWKLFGEHDVETTAIPRFIKACLRNEPLTLYNEGKDVTDPTYILNFCYAVELALEKDEAVGEVFNLGTGKKVSIRELAEKIRQLTGSSSELQLLPPRTEAEREPMKSYPSIEKIRRILRYEPIVDFEEGLRRTIEFYRRKLDS
ncbi:MAG: NAD-dependent epimerase/dehydratase family protein [Aigarchaeota archaeon]|nr:NAD-dependent epimerase/dehydratase family protein [Aigarchaeota archaeon]MDW8021488.1 NAD-dependent epimerase/dehydratase family protein [Nitrososphaerota archaeon]